MQTQESSFTIDSRAALRGYAVLVSLAGLVVAGWGQQWLGSDLAGQPWGRAALIRVFGALLIAAGCVAAGLSTIEEPPSRRRALLWFAVAHGAVLVMVLVQREAVWGEGLADWVASLLIAAVLTLVYFLGSLDRHQPGESMGMTTLFGNRAHASTDRLRSTYEQQIREAASQEERNRLARDLHDSIKQQVFAIQTAAATAQVRFDRDSAGAKAALDQVRHSAREAMIETEAMLDQLRSAPLENVGLVEALRKQCEALGFRTGARVEFKAGTLPPSKALAPGAHQAIFRVAQEALANVGRHARAGTVRVVLDGAEDAVRLVIQDDGAGFGPEGSGSGSGIGNMRARAGEFDGTLEVTSRPGIGTTVALSVPCARRAAGESLVFRPRLIFWSIMLTLLILQAVWGVTHNYRDFVLMPFTLGLVAAVVLACEALAYIRARRREAGGS
jgi:signal transduction histidine kinase